jgi:hypothetical protein
MLQGLGLNANVRIFRVVGDIAWNIAGARNLALWMAQTEWVFCADIDHIVTAAALHKMLNLDFLDRKIVYTFGRRTAKGSIGVDAIVNFLMNREAYFELGGHDEDFSGQYGYEETFFKKCLSSRGFRIHKCEDIMLDWYPKRGATRGLTRDRSLNLDLFGRKMSELKAHTYRNGPILRFEWTQTHGPKRRSTEPHKQAGLLEIQKYGNGGSRG